MKVQVTVQGNYKQKLEFENVTNLKHFGKTLPIKKVAWTNKLKAHKIQRIHATTRYKMFCLFVT
jgi:hypothetical protein